MMMKMQTMMVMLQDSNGNIHLHLHLRPHPRPPDPQPTSQQSSPLSSNSRITKSTPITPAVAFGDASSPPWTSLNGSSVIAGAYLGYISPGARTTTKRKPPCHGPIDFVHEHSGWISAFRNSALYIMRIRTCLARIRRKKMPGWSSLRRNGTGRLSSFIFFFCFWYPFCSTQITSNERHRTSSTLLLSLTITFCLSDAISRI